MRKLLIILLFLPLPLFGTDYYVKTGGSDAANGLTDGTAWGTISKVNTVWSAGTFAPGDRILFNRGDTFVGTLTPAEAGSSGSLITIGAYGSGADPIITGFSTITGWTNEGSGIYSKTLTVESSKVEMVSVDGVNTGTGRYPDAGTNLTFESHSGTTSITDNQLTGSPDWDGAEVVMRKLPWVIERCLVSNHTTTTVTYTELSGTGQEPDLGANGYFFQNDLRTLTTLGEWYYGGGKFYMYFGAVDPTTKTVKVATLDNAVLTTSDYIALDNISFTGYNKTGIDFDGSANSEITNCEISFIGGRGVIMGAGNTVDLCNIHDINANGIDADNGTFTITNSTIERIAQIVGGGYGWDGQGYGVLASGATGLVQYCVFHDIAYDGTYLRGNNTSVLNNLFDNCVSRMFDGGAIYTNMNGSGKVISDNIILNTIGSTEMSDRSLNFWNTAEGIYLDAPCSGVTVSGNTIYTAGNGIKLHKTHDVTVTDNRIYDCSVGGINYLNSSVDADVIRNVAVDGTHIVAFDGTQGHVVATSVAADIADFGTSVNQYYARPIDDAADHDFYTEEISGGAWSTLATWQSVYESDADAVFSSVSASSESEFHFVYNASKTAVNYTVTGTMYDVTGASVSGDVALQPYASLFLVGDGEITLSSGSAYTLLKSNGKFLRHNGKLIKR